jgi:hypothetical protein
MNNVVYFGMLIIAINMWFLVAKKRGDAEQRYWIRYLFLLFVIPALLSTTSIIGAFYLDKSPATGMLPKQSGCQSIMPGWYMLVTVYLVVLVACICGFLFSGTFQLNSVKMFINDLVSVLVHLIQYTKSLNKDLDAKNFHVQRVISSSLYYRTTLFTIGQAILIGLNICATMETVQPYFRQPNPSRRVGWWEFAPTSVGIILFVIFGTGIATQTVLSEFFDKILSKNRPNQLDARGRRRILSRRFNLKSNKSELNRTANTVPAALDDNAINKILFQDKPPPPALTIQTKPFTAQRSPSSMNSVISQKTWETASVSPDAPHLSPSSTISFAVQSSSTSRK